MFKVLFLVQFMYVFRLKQTQNIKENSLYIYCGQLARQDRLDEEALNSFVKMPAGRVHIVPVIIEQRCAKGQADNTLQREEQCSVFKASIVQSSPFIFNQFIYPCDGLLACDTMLMDVTLHGACRIPLALSTLYICLDYVSH